MLNGLCRDNLNRVVILNPKGGCGKSTLATNLAAAYAARGDLPAVMDYDPQGSTTAWLERRPGDLPAIHGIAAFRRDNRVTRSFQLRIPPESNTVIVDTPAGVTHGDLPELTRRSSSILVPVLPSEMDIHAASRCIADLLLVAQINRNERKLAVVANRTRANTKSFVRLMRFLDSLGIPIIAVLRDSQNFVHAAEQGLGIVEMQPSRVQKDLAQFDNVTRWLDDWQQRKRAARAMEAAAARAKQLRQPPFGQVALQRVSAGSV